MKLPDGFKLRKKRAISYIACSKLEKAGLAHGFTLRTGGFSKKPYDSLNFGMHTDDNKKTVRRNILLAEKAIGARIAAAKQVHGDRIVEVRSPESRHCLSSGGLAGARSQIQNTEADAVVTDVPGIAASVRVADCAGTIIYDPENKVVAAVHSGWRGVANKIPAKTVKLMRKKFGSYPAKLLAAVSPAIGPCCFEVGPEVYKLRRQKVFSNIFTSRKGRVYMDIWKGAVNLLVSAGIKRKNISVCRMCTSCNPKLFFSHRRDKGKTGRMMVFGVRTPEARYKEEDAKLETFI